MTSNSTRADAVDAPLVPAVMDGASAAAAGKGWAATGTADASDDEEIPARSLYEHDMACAGHLPPQKTVGVFCRSAGTWLLGHVVQPRQPGLISVEFLIDGQRCLKHTRPGSKDILQGPTSLTSADLEAFAALRRDVTACSGGGGASPVADTLSLSPVGNCAFASARPLEEDCEIEFRGPSDVDMTLKVYALDAGCPQRALDRFVLQGYVHAMQQPREPVRVAAGRTLGLVLNVGLNEEWLWKLRDEDPEQYEKFMLRSAPLGWKDGSRDDVEAQTSAGDADYLISFTSGDKEENDSFLRRLVAEPVRGPHGHRPVTVCTDRSLGFGGHFDAPAGLYLGKHGFGQSTGPRAWLKAFLEAGNQTAHGVLILNPSAKYFASAECRKEFYNSYAPDRVCVYDGQCHRIFPREEWFSELKKGTTPIHSAVAQGSLQEVQCVLHGRPGAVHDVNHLGQTPLHFAARDGHVDIMACLLDARATLSPPNNAGSTPLHWAAGKGQDAAAAWLIAARAEVHARNTEKGTPLHLAVISGHVTVAARLFAEGAGISGHTASGHTMLGLAASFGHEAATSWLLGVGADVDARTSTPFPIEKEAKDSTAATPLLLAAAGGHDDVLLRLVAARADLGAKTGSGSTALDLAVQNGREATIALLREMEPQQWCGGHAEALLLKTTAASSGPSRFLNAFGEQEEVR